MSTSHIRSLYRAFLRELPPSYSSTASHSTSPSLSPAGSSAQTTTTTTTRSPVARRIRTHFSPLPPHSSSSSRSSSQSSQSQPTRTIQSTPSPLHGSEPSAAPNPSSFDTTETSPEAEAGDTVETDSLIQQAQQYLHYLRAQRTYTALLERYNPGMSMDMNEEERVRLSARRVGMDMPVDSEMGGGGGGKGGRDR